VPWGKQNFARTGKRGKRYQERATRREVRSRLTNSRRGGKVKTHELPTNPREKGKLAAFTTGETRKEKFCFTGSKTVEESTLRTD